MSEASGLIQRAYVRDWTDRKSHFGILVDKSLPRDRKGRYLGVVQSFDAKPKRRLWEHLCSQCLQLNRAATFLTDGGDAARNLAAEMAPYAEHHVHWLHITMRPTVLLPHRKVIGEGARGRADGAAFRRPRCG